MPRASRFTWVSIAPLAVAFAVAVYGGACTTEKSVGDDDTSTASSSSSGGPDAGCTSGEIDCAGTCVDVKTSPANCGGCGLACPSGDTCCGGATCSSDPSCAMTVTSMSPNKGLINGGQYVTLHGTGFAAGIRAYVGDGRAPVRVVDDKTATMLTPPSPQGIYDVEVRVGTATSTLPHAFTVTSETFGDAWVEIEMSSPRGNFPGMTTLQDGRVLIEGGTATSDPATTLTTAELYDPKTKTMSLAPGTMSVARQTTTAITLLDGRALILGVCNGMSGPGCTTPGDRVIAELFDPATGTFTLTKTPLNDTTRVYFHPTLLPDGKVLITSACSCSTAELFDPDTDGFTVLPIAASGMPARLRDGRVLFVGGGIEVFDPDTGMLTSLGGSLDHQPDAVFTLPDGRVGCVGGATLVNGMITPNDELVIVDPVNQTATLQSQKLSTPRMKFASALLGSGEIMVGGGVTAPYPPTYSCASDSFPTTSAVDVVNFAAGTDHAFPTLNDSEMELVATTLLDGSILVGGGAACGGGVAYPHVYFLNGIPPPN